MTSTMPTINRTKYAIAQLMRDHPPRLYHPHKRLVFDIACPEFTRHEGEIEFARWSSEGWQDLVTKDEEPVVDCLPGVFSYDPPIDGAIDWYLNFADPNLFGFYGGGLLAQDELQVAEHPALACLREALIDNGIEPETMDGSAPTPCTVVGVPRHCVIDTSPSDQPGREAGLYGNRFAAAREEVVRSAIEPIDPPTLSNILAIAAPPGGAGFYTADDIEQILSTVVTGFAAVMHQSEEMGIRDVSIHTGFWGCGAFGGNRVLTPALQLVAARWLGLPRFVFYAFDENGQREFSAALNVARRLSAEEDESDRVASVIEAAVNLRMQWGVSDGN